MRLDTAPTPRPSAEGAARELDRLIALCVMGWTEWANLAQDCPCEQGVTYFADWGDMGGIAVYTPPHLTGDVEFYFEPSVDISDAMRVAEKLKADDFWPSMTWKSGVVPGEINRAVWFVRFRCVRGGTRGDHWAYDESLPLAICRAALKVMESLRASADELLKGEG